MASLALEMHSTLIVRWRSFFKVDGFIQRSVGFAWDNPERSESFIKEHAQETEESVVKSHIGLYVNDFSAHMGDKGSIAIKRLQQLIAPASGDVKSLFAY